VTIKNLELIVSLKEGNKTSLYGAMNRTYTACGARLLRSCLLQPPANVDVINQRLNAVEELLSNESVGIDGWEFWELLVLICSCSARCDR
jgi:DNA mismatch repair ATPase MutS